MLVFKMTVVHIIECLQSLLCVFLRNNAIVWERPDHSSELRQIITSANAGEAAADWSVELRT